MTPSESWQAVLQSYQWFDGLPYWDHIPPFRTWVEQLSTTGIRLALFASVSNETLIISKDYDEPSDRQSRAVVHPWCDGNLTIFYYPHLGPKEEIPCSLADGKKLIERYMMRLVKETLEVGRPSAI